MNPGVKVRPQRDVALLRKDLKPELLQIWLDFEGGELHLKSNCAYNAWNQTCLEGAEGYYAPFVGSVELQAAIREELEALLFEYNVRISVHRPLNGQVVHLIFSRKPGFARSYFGTDVYGFGPIDCANWNATETAFVLDDEERTALNYAVTAVHEVGHALGFEHVSALPLNPMTAGSAGNILLDVCLPVSLPRRCTDDDRAWWGCPSGQRNYHQELLALTWGSPSGNSTE
jgi:hypothetical protein